MGMFLNSSVPYESYKEVLQDKYFVDKTMLIDELIPALGRENRRTEYILSANIGQFASASMEAVS